MDIEFPGCMLRLDIPNGWNGEQEEEYAVLLSRRAAHGGELRLLTNMYTVKGMGEANVSEMVAGLAKKQTRSADGQVYRLASGALASCALQTLTDVRPPLKSITWYVGVLREPDTLLIVTFDYTVPIPDTTYPEVAAEIQLLSELVNSTEYYFAAEE